MFNTITIPTIGGIRVLNEHYNEIPSLSEDPEEEDDLKSVDMVPSEDQLLTTNDDDNDTTTDEDDNAVEDEAHETDDGPDESDDDVPLDEQEEEENTIMSSTTTHHTHHAAESMIEKEHTTTNMPGMLNLHLNLNLNKEGEQSMSQRKAALTVDEVNQQNNVKDTGYNFQSAQERPATLDEYDLSNEPRRDFDNMQGQTSVYSMRATATTAMRLAARMLKHSLRDGDPSDPSDVAEVADEIRDTMSEGEARDKADILKELDDKNDDEIREIEHEIHDDKDHEKMDRKDIHDDEEHLDRLEKARRASRHRKASLDVDRHYFDEFCDFSPEWADLLTQLSDLDEDELSELDDDELERLDDGIRGFLFDFSDRTLDNLDDVRETIEDMLEDDGPAFASRHSRRRAAEDERTVCDVRKTKDGDFEARCDGKVKRFDKKGDALEWLSDHFDDSYHDEPEFHVKHDESRRARRRHAEEDEKTVCDVRKTKDGDFEARCDGKVKRFDKKGDALEWLSDHFDDSYKDEPEFHVKHDDEDKKEARQARLQKLITAHRKQMMSSNRTASAASSTVRMASSMSPAKNDISSILL